MPPAEFDNVNQDAQMIDEADDNEEYGEEEEDYDENDYYEAPTSTNQANLGNKISIPFFGGSIFPTQTQTIP